MVLKIFSKTKKRDMSVFRDNTLKNEIVKPSDWKGIHVHDEDILCAAIMKNIPMFLATGGFDGEIVIWNSVTELPHKRLISRKRALPNKTNKEVMKNWKFSQLHFLN
jgi:hypothetical protein